MWGITLAANGDVAFTSQSPDVAPPGRDSGSSLDLFISRNQAPGSLAITATPETGQPPLAVAFTGSATDLEGEVGSYAWDFGDGATATGPIVDHTYLVAGTYTATLTATDRDGASASTTRSIAVVVPPGGAGPPPPGGGPVDPAPVVTGFSVSPRRFALAAGPTGRHGGEGQARDDVPLPPLRARAGRRDASSGRGADGAAAGAASSRPAGCGGPGAAPASRRPAA